MRDISGGIIEVTYRANPQARSHYAKRQHPGRCYELKSVPPRRSELMTYRTTLIKGHIHWRQKLSICMVQSPTVPRAVRMATWVLKLAGHLMSSFQPSTMLIISSVETAAFRNSASVQPRFSNAAVRVSQATLACLRCCSISPPSAPSSSF